MGVKNLVGILLCAVLFLTCFLTVDGASYFLNGIGLLIVLSGTLGATLMSYPWEGFRAAIQVGWSSYRVTPPTPEDVVQDLIRVSVRSRYDGLLAMERYESQVTGTFFRNALEMMVDGYDARELRDVLGTEMAFFRRRRQQHERVYRHMARLAPAFGVAGSVVGLMSMLFGVGDTAVILRTIPLALTSTLYGIVISNFVLTPAAESIHAKTMKELLIQKLVLDGVQAILAEQNPHKLERKLESFLTPAARDKRQRSLEEIRRRYAELQAERDPVRAG